MNKFKEHKTPNGNIWYRLNNDSYGNPRVMAHFMSLVSPMQEREARRLNAGNACASIKTLKKWAREEVNGKSYRAEWFGGGIVWTSYLSDKQINDLIDGIQTK